MDFFFLLVRCLYLLRLCVGLVVFLICFFIFMGFRGGTNVYKWWVLVSVDVVVVIIYYAA